MTVPLYQQLDTDAAEEWDRVCYRDGDPMDFVKLGTAIGDDVHAAILRLLVARGNTEATRALRLLRTGRALIMAAVADGGRHSLYVPTDADIEEFVTAAQKGWAE